MLKPGEVILATIQYTDTFEVKTRPALVLFEEMGNIVVAGITSNKKMKGVPLTKQEGAVKGSVIKTNYLFTISEGMVKKKLFELTTQKKKEVYNQLEKKLRRLVSKVF